jgi:hypothetical protein
VILSPAARPAAGFRHKKTSLYRNRLPADFIKALGTKKV